MERSPYFLMILISCYDIIMKLSEYSELSEDYLAEMPVKLGLVQITANYFGFWLCNILSCYLKFVSKEIRKRHNSAYLAKT